MSGLGLRKWTSALRFPSGRSVGGHLVFKADADHYELRRMIALLELDFRETAMTCVMGLGDINRSAYHHSVDGQHQGQGRRANHARSIHREYRDPALAVVGQCKGRENVEERPASPVRRPDAYCRGAGPPQLEADCPKWASGARFGPCRDVPGPWR
jgi:hypothetical protein